jgi:pyrroline-5-carboxylate reductase
MAENFPRILIFGCGNMGGAMLLGWLAAGVSPDRFVVVDPAANGLPDGVRVNRSAADLGETFEVVLLGIKPQMLKSLTPDIAPLIAPDAVVISILAGAQTSTLSSHFSGARIVRLMPNLAAAIGKSPLGLFSNQLGVEARGGISNMLSALGTPIWLEDEADMDAVTALAGSGPAFVYRFIDALARGGIAMGLSDEVAKQMALAMAEGAVALAAASPESPAALAARVTSPGGTTAAGLSVLDRENALNNLIEATLRAAQARGAELAKGDSS